VIGGGHFLGPAVVRAGLGAGHVVTTLTRSGLGVPAGAQSLLGDRETAEGLSVLRGGEWDAVVDTCGYVPRMVGTGARALADVAGHYVFVSSISAYDGWPERPVTADTPLLACPADAGPDDGGTASSRRAASGRCSSISRAAAWSPESVTWSESGTTWDGCRTGFGEWPAAARCSRPGHHSGRCRWSTFGMSGPGWSSADSRSWPVPWRHQARRVRPRSAALFGAAVEATGSDPTFVWADDAFLLAQEVEPWQELPYWLPAEQFPGAEAVDTSAALAAGLDCRPVSETVRDTWGWLREVGAPPQRSDRPAPGLDPARESALLATWRARH